MQLTPGRRVRNHWYNPYRSTFNGIQRHKQDNPACLGPLEEAVRESSSLKLKDTAASRIDRQWKGHFSTRRRETAIVWHFCHLISINKSLSLETGKGGYGASEATSKQLQNCLQACLLLWACVFVEFSWGVLRSRRRDGFWRRRCPYFTVLILTITFLAS